MWASVEDVRARLTYETVDSASSPSSAQIAGWLVEAEAMIKTVLRAAKLPTSYNDIETLAVLRSLCANYAVGHIFMAWGSKSGDTELDAGRQLLEAFEAKLEMIRRKAIQFGSELSASGATAQAVRKFRSHTTDNTSSASPSDVSSAIITVDEVF